MSQVATQLLASNAISYADGPRIRRAFAAGITKVIECQEHLNKINVFPVADGDTGTNLALTMRAIQQILLKPTSQPAGHMMMAIADAALDGARGNSGAIVAQFFQGVSDALNGAERVSALQFAQALENGDSYARDALSHPREGTVLTVMRDFSQRVKHLVTVEAITDFTSLFSDGLEHARLSLANTPNQLEELRKAGVVDAGAEGFVRFLEGIYQYILDGDIALVMTADDKDYLHEEGAHETMAGEVQDLDFRYCTECLVNGKEINRRKLKEELSALGGSLVLAGTNRKAKIHIHVNEPAKVFEVAARFGAVSGQKADDMQQQQDISHHRVQPVVICIDSAADLPDSELERLNIHMIPVRLHFGNESYLDKVTINSEDFYAKLQNHPVHPQTAQPSPGEFRRNFNFLASHYDHVLSIQVTSWGSGTYQAAVSAAERLATDTVRVFDSKSASIGQGLLAIHAAELANGGALIDEIENSLTIARQETRVFGVLPELTYSVRGGRVKPIVKKVADLFNLVPLFALNQEGRLLPKSVLFGKKNLPRRLAQRVAKKVSRGDIYRVAIACGNNKQDAHDLIESLTEAFTKRGATIESHYITSVGSALGVHAGPNCITLGLQRRNRLN